MATNFFEIGYHFKNGDQLLGIGYHFKIFRSQVATRKKVNFKPCSSSKRSFSSHYKYMYMTQTTCIQFYTLCKYNFLLSNQSPFAKVFLTSRSGVLWWYIAILLKEVDHFISERHSTQLPLATKENTLGHLGKHTWADSFGSDEVQLFTIILKCMDSCPPKCRILDSPSSSIIKLIMLPCRLSSMLFPLIKDLFAYIISWKWGKIYNVANNDRTLFNTPNKPACKIWSCFGNV